MSNSTEDAPPLAVGSLPNDETQDKIAYSHVDGAGMWRQWTRSFTKPIRALLDLFDNCVDACVTGTNVHAGDQVAKIRAYEDIFQPNGLVLVNSSKKKLLPLSEIMVVFRSEKKNNVQMGENGVGLKHACANLSPLSFLLTKSNGRNSFGILSEYIQGPGEPKIPSFQFRDSSSLSRQLVELASKDPDIRKCLRTYGKGSLADGVTFIQKHFRAINHGEWAEYDDVFCIVMCSLRHTGSTEKQEGDLESSAGSASMSKAGAKTLLDTLAEELPRRYLHLSTSFFDVRINGKVVNFQYWERRLVELTTFVASYNKHIPWDSETPDDLNTSDGKTTRIKIHCGFDPARCVARSPTAQLLIYSRRSGRLIKEYKDCRLEIGLSAGGTDYCQGLTIIIDDFYGYLPLDPTKQNLGFAHEESEGGIHSRNLMSWVGACAQLFWKYHSERFTRSTRKKSLTDAVRASLDDIKRIKDMENIPELASGNFSKFENVRWRKYKGKLCSTSRGYDYTMGSATLVTLNAVSAISSDDEDSSEATAPVAAAAQGRPRKRRAAASKSMEVIRTAMREHAVAEQAALASWSAERIPRRKPSSVRNVGGVGVARTSACDASPRTCQSCEDMRAQMKGKDGEIGKLKEENKELREVIWQLEEQLSRLRLEAKGDSPSHGGFRRPTDDSESLHV